MLVSVKLLPKYVIIIYALGSPQKPFGDWIKKEESRSKLKQAFPIHSDAELFMYLIQCIGFGPWKVRRLNRALGDGHLSRAIRNTNHFIPQELWVSFIASLPPSGSSLCPSYSERAFFNVWSRDRLVIRRFVLRHSATFQHPPATIANKEWNDIACGISNPFCFIKNIFSWFLLISGLFNFCSHWVPYSPLNHLETSSSIKESSSAHSLSLGWIRSRITVRR